MTARRAIIETDGMGKLRGVWVANVDHGAPDCAFLDDIDQLVQERKLGSAARQLDTYPEMTWDGFMDWLLESYHPLICKRYTGTTELSPDDLLAAADRDHSAANFHELLGIDPTQG